MFQIMVAVTEFEQSLIKERQLEGSKKARNNWYFWPYIGGGGGS